MADDHRRNRRHFGSDASRDAKTVAGIGAHLEAHTAGEFGSASTVNSDRITLTGWFVREHRNVAAAFATPVIGSATNCGACHPDASRGEFDEHRVRVPATTSSER